MRHAVQILALAAVLLFGTRSVSGQDPKRATVTGNVVDAACFMIHPQAAETASHSECGNACIARGVPMAIVNEADGQLYFPADPKRLAAFHNKRVTASGAFVHKAEPMELKMPVGASNEMAVKVTGGYNLLTIEQVTAAPKRIR